MRTTLNTPPHRVRHSGLSLRAFRGAAILIVLALALIALDREGVLAPIKSRAQAVLRPVEQTMTQTRMGLRRDLDVMLGSPSLRQQVQDLQEQVAQLREQNIRLQGLQTENNQLKLELGIRQTYEWKTLAASIVQSNAENARRIVRIDRGRIDGVALGMPVAAKEGGSPAALIGIVDTLYAQTADVLLITDYGSSISANTTQQARAKGLVLGQWQLGSRIKLVDVDPAVLLKPGDYVVTSGLSKGLATDTPMAQILPNIPIGTVTDVARTNHTQTAEVQPFVDPDRVRTVWVITGQK